LPFNARDVIGLLVDDLLRDVALAPHRIDRDDRPFDRQHRQQFGDRDDLVGLFRDFDLAEHQTLAGGEGGNHVDGGFAGALGPAHGLAIDGNHAGWNAGQRGNPCDKAPLKLIGVQHRQDVAEVAVVRRTILERTEAAKKCQLLDPEQGDLGESFAPGKHAEQAQQQDLIERVGHLPLLARVVEVFEMTQKDDRFVECTAVRCCVVHCRSPQSESRIGIDSAL
jgi:hypothetical protein